MANLGDLLSALHDAEESYDSVDSRWVVIEEDGMPGGSGARLRVAGKRWREDRDEDTVVSDGDHWWSTIGLGGPRSGTGRPLVSFGFPELALLMAPGRLLGEYRFAILGEDEVAGRPVLLARATPRFGVEDEAGMAPWDALGDEADEHLLAVDRERGVILRCVSLWDGQQTASAEVTEIAFDVPVEEDVFALDRPATRVERPGEVALVTDPRSVAAQLPFTLYFPVGLAGFHATAVAPPLHDGAPPMAFVHLTGAEGHIHIHQHGSDARIEFGAPRRGRPEARLTLQRGGTQILLTSTDVDEARLAEVAETLEPVSR